MINRTSRTAMILGPLLRKLALTAHVTFSVSWLGAVSCFLVLALAGVISEDAQTVRAVYLGMDLTALFVILPLAGGSLVTGLVQSLGTTWGLFRHYWVLAKFVITVVAALVFVKQLAPISRLAEVAAEMPLARTDFRGARLSLVVHAGGGLLVLLVPVVLSVYKPRGLTPYGRRKQRDHRTASPR